MPHSSVSRISNRCRALRFSVTRRNSGSVFLPAGFFPVFAMLLFNDGDNLRAVDGCQPALCQRAITLPRSEGFFRALLSPSSYIPCLAFACPGPVATFPPPRRLLPSYPAKRNGCHVA